MNTTICNKNNSINENHLASEENESFQKQMTKKEVNGTDKAKIYYCNDLSKIPAKICIREVKIVKVESKRSIKHYWIINRLKNPSWKTPYIIGIRSSFKYFKNYIEHENIYADINQKVFIGNDGNTYIYEETNKCYQVRYEFSKYGNAPGHEYFN